MEDDKFQSIEDLITSSAGGSVDEESTEGKFAKKQNEIKLKDMERQTQGIANNAGMPYINLVGFPISPDAISLISKEESSKMKALCFFYDGTNLRIGTTEKDSQEVQNLLKDLCAKYFCKGSLYLISPNSLRYALTFYDNLPKIRKIVLGVEIKGEDLKNFEKEISDYKSLNEIINKVSITDVVTLIIATALKTGASDIHIEAEEKGIVVRLRIDGVLQDAAVIEKEKWKKIISRLKMLAKVKINIEGKPQDGRFTIFTTEKKDEKIDVRCSFLPTSFGESVVMRLLKSSSVGVPFDKLGLRPIQYELLNKEISKPNGLILTTGPTGSGKTTTLYAILNKLNTTDSKIITLEDPIEYKLEGINQSQVDVSKDYTFSKGLRSILRQDPDILMVGEIRDLETAEIAVQASLTGHLVLSTLHTNDASGVIPRLLDMGVKPFFLIPAINCVIGQRLVRKICPSCRVEHVLVEEEAEKLNKILSVVSPKSGVDIPTALPKIYKAGKGCNECGGIGYKGRLGIYEIFSMDNDIKELTSNGAPSFKILEKAIENGMLTMLQDGVLKVIEGLTDLDEVYRVIGKLDYIDALYDIIVSKIIGRGIKISNNDLEVGEKLSKKIDAKLYFDTLIKTPTREMMNIIVAAALKSEAGDIHIDPTEKGVRIRYRIDGILHDIVELGKEHYIPIMTNIKDLAGFSINEKRASYDGRFSIFLEKSKMDCRISIISGGYGETAVIRLLTSDASKLKLENLGIRMNSLNMVENAMKKTKGVIITTGPTGSGKTTTLYAVLNKLNKPDVKIITIEDPIEYHLEGVMQTQINTEQGYTFALALRSLMRQNPNINMVGEIRDNETAKVTIESAQTGHLVLSTLHANSAASAIFRFLGLGVDKQALASSIECSIGQRLVRQVCQFCKVEDKVDDKVIKEVEAILKSIDPSTGINIPKEYKFYKGKGCDKCAHIGYKGRLGIYEVIDMSPEMQKLIQATDVTDFEIEKLAVKHGTLLMMQDGVLKALNGETTIDEVFRVAR